MLTPQVTNDKGISRSCRRLFYCGLLTRLSPGGSLCAHRFVGVEAVRRDAGAGEMNVYHGPANHLKYFMKTLSFHFMRASLLAAGCFLSGVAAEGRSNLSGSPVSVAAEVRKVWKLTWDDKVDDAMARGARECRVALEFEKEAVTGGFDGPVLGVERKAFFTGRVAGAGRTALLLLEQREGDYTCAFQMQAAGDGCYFGVWHDTRGGKGDAELRELTGKEGGGEGKRDER